MNPNTIHYLNMFLGTGAIALQLITVVSLLVLFFGPRKNKYFEYIEKHFLAIGLLLSTSAALFALVYSEIVNFAPCYLCWYQRVFMFPLIFIFAVALWDNDKKVIKYVLPLLSAGFLVSVYQNFGYYFGEANGAPCDSSGVSCYKHLVSEFGGYISIPMLALTVFFSLLVLALVVHFYQKRQ